MVVPQSSFYKKELQHLRDRLSNIQNLKIPDADKNELSEEIFLEISLVKSCESRDFTREADIELAKRMADPTMGGIL